MTQLPGLVVTVCWAKHASLSIGGRVHNRHCYCYWCDTHITVIGAIRTSLLLVPYHRYYVFVIDIFYTVFKMVFIRYYLYSECIENNMLLLPKIIVTVLKWFLMAII